MTQLYHRHWSRQDLVRYTGQMDQVAGIRLLEAAEGAGHSGGEAMRARNALPCLSGGASCSYVVELEVIEYD